jgi:hypothetical protein
MKFKWGPRDDGLLLTLLTATGEFIIIVKTLIDFFSFDKMFEADEFENECVSQL